MHTEQTIAVNAVRKSKNRMLNCGLDKPFLGLLPEGGKDESPFAQPPSMRHVAPAHKGQIVIGETLPAYSLMNTTKATKDSRGVYISVRIILRRPDLAAAADS